MTYRDHHILSLPRPVLVIGGSSDVDLESMGAFQELPQVSSTFTSRTSRLWFYM